MKYEDWLQDGADSPQKRLAFKSAEAKMQELENHLSFDSVTRKMWVTIFINLYLTGFLEGYDVAERRYT